MPLPVSPAALRALVRELEASRRDHRPLAVGGARELAAVLRRELARGASPGAVREGDEPEGALALVYVLGRDPDASDEAALGRARRARVPVVAVVAGPVAGDLSLPSVLATDVVRVGAGEGFPVEAIARAVAGRLGEAAAPLASRLPVLRPAVARAIVASSARANGLVGAAVFVPGADLPVLLLNQLRMLLRLAQAHGEELGRDRILELAAAVGAGLGLRALARELLELVPLAGWAVKGAVAYGGTRALGEVALRRLEAGATS